MENNPTKSGERIQLAMDLHGMAMLDYMTGSQDVAVIIHRDDGFAYPPVIAARWFYENGFPILDTKALDLCRGRVLNVGAASGAHSIFLESKGLEVVSIDASPCAIEVMRRKGVRQPRLGDIHNLAADPFDTILLLCGIGVVGTLEGLTRFFAVAREHLKNDGVIITDCTHPRADTLEASQKYCDYQVAQGRYEGERTIRFEYGGSFGPWFNWLAIAPEVLGDCARTANFSFEVIYSEVGRSLCVLKSSGSI